MKQNKWSASKKIYLTLSILLSIQVIPFLGMVINMIFVMAIAGLILSIVLLVTTTKDQVSKGGAVLGLITFAMAIVSGMFSWAMTGRIGDGTIALIFLWMFVNWAVCIAAVIVCYITTFSKKRNPADYVGGSSFPGTPQMKAPKATETVKVGFGGDISLSEVKFNDQKQQDTAQSITPIRPIETTTIPPNIPAIQKVETSTQVVEETKQPTPYVGEEVLKEEKPVTYVTQVMGNELAELLKENEEKKQNSTSVSAEELEK